MIAFYRLLRCHVGVLLLKLALRVLPAAIRVTIVDAINKAFP